MSREVQEKLERTYNKNILLKRVFSEITGDMDLQGIVKDSGCDVDLTNKALAFLAIYKRFDLSTMVAILFKPEGKQSLDEVIHQVELMIEKKLVHYDPDEKKAIVRFELDDTVQAEIGCFQYPLPLVVKPKLLKHNMASAYFLKNKQSVLLNDHKTKKDVDLEHLNLMNQVAFTVNKTVYAKAVNKWTPKTDSDPSQTRRQMERFNKYCKVSQDIIMENGNKFYFSHRYDYRGRTYCEGYYLNYQGNDYCKAILEFANKEIVE